MKFKCLSAAFASSCLKTAQEAVWKQCTQATIRWLLLQEVSWMGVVISALGLVAPPRKERDKAWCSDRHSETLPSEMARDRELPQVRLGGRHHSPGLPAQSSSGQVPVQGFKQVQSTPCLMSWANNQLFPVQSLFFFLPGACVSLFLAAVFYKSSLARWQIYLLPGSAALVSIYRSQPKSVLDLLWTELEVVIKTTDWALFFWQLLGHLWASL